MWRGDHGWGWIEYVALDTIKACFSPNGSSRIYHRTFADADWRKAHRWLDRKCFRGGAR